MGDYFLIGFATIIVLGIGAQWIAWRMGLPTILVFLVFGFIAGPVTGIIDPNKLFGDLLLPIVSISVGIILFEGGLSLRFSEIREVRRVVFSLVTVGVVITWIATSIAAYLLLGLGIEMSTLFGAIVVSTGTTVIIPLIRDIRPSGKVGSMLKWEGIVTDPIAALLAVLVFEVIVSGSVGKATTQVVFSVLKSLVLGGVAGLAAARLVVLLLSRHWVPDFLQNAVSLLIVITAFTVSNLIQTESGLISVTVMGIVLANQKAVSVRQLKEFKETLRVLFISCVFIILAARLTTGNVEYVANVNSLLFLAVFILAVRPLSVFISTHGSGLNLREKVFLSSVAPRGIVAAAVSSVFALRLGITGYPQADHLVDYSFLVIAATVAFYGVIASPVARHLGLSQQNPQGVLIVGAHGWARAIAKFLQDNGFQITLVDSNWANITAARQEGLTAFYQNILQEDSSEEMDLGGLGRLLALTSNEEVNSLAALHFIQSFGRSNVYQLPSHAKFRERTEDSIPKHLRGRLLFAPEATYSDLSRRFASGAVIKKTPLTEAFGYDEFKALYGGRALPLFLIKESGELIVFAHDNPPLPQPGQQIVALVNDTAEKNNGPA